MTTCSKRLRFEDLAHEWEEARRGQFGSTVRLAHWLEVDAEDVTRALCEAATLDDDIDDPQRFAVVATLRTRAQLDEWSGDVVSAVAALTALQRAIVDALDRIDDFGPAFRTVAAALLAERPRLDGLRGRARLLEELRRDVLREPRLPLPEGLDELLEETTDVTPTSPPIRALESSPSLGCR